MGNKVIPITKNKTSDEIEKEISIFRLGYDMDNPDSMINYIRNLTMQRLQKLNITKSDDLEIADHNILLGALRTYIEILEKDLNKNKEKKMTWGEYKIFKKKSYMTGKYLRENGITKYSTKKEVDKILQNKGKNND